ncbi:MAG: COX15/CtaA family protein [Acidimicrobiales bacterium]
MQLPPVSPDTYRRITVFALVALGVIVVTGAAVRLTGSGLGCSDWPGCEQDRFVPALELHPMVEGVNRLITGLVSLAVAVAVLGSFARVPRRRDLVWLSLGLVGGVVGQIVLGLLTVEFDLWPPLVMGHFVVSMGLLANATVLHHRAGLVDGDQGQAVRERPAVGNEVARLGRWLVVAAGLVIVTGTVVTGSGPHGGDEHVDRLPFFVPDVARIHGIAMMVFLGTALALFWLAQRERIPAELHQRLHLLLLIIVAQAAVGYAQYLTSVPPLLVGLHVAGATVLWWATLRVSLAMKTPVPETAPALTAARLKA